MRRTKKGAYNETTRKRAIDECRRRCRKSREYDKRDVSSNENRVIRALKRVNCISSPFEDILPTECSLRLTFIVSISTIVSSTVAIS